MIIDNLHSIMEERANLLHGAVLIQGEVMENVSDELVIGTQPIMEKAEFSFFPRFKKFVDKYPEMKDYEDLIEDAEEIIKLSGKKVDDHLDTKISKVIFKIVGTLASVDSVIILPWLVFIFPIFGYLFDRLVVYLMDILRFGAAEKEIKRTKRALLTSKNQTKDKKVTAQIDKMIKKLDDELEKIKNGEEVNKTMKESGEIEEDDIDFLAEFRDEIEDVDVDDLLDSIGTLPDTTTEEVDRIIDFDEDRPITPDDILLDEEEQEIDEELDDDDIDDLMHA